MLGLLGSILSGGATGLLGVLLQRFFDYKAAKAKQENEVELRKIDLELMKQEYAGKLQVASAEASARVESEDAAAFAVSLQSEPKQYSERVALTTAEGWILVLLDALRGIVRPALTLYLCAITTVIYFKAHVLAGELLPGQAFTLEQQIIQTILYLCTTCVLWWFGVRGQRSK